jgi:hypothetical protein
MNDQTVDVDRKRPRAKAKRRRAPVDVGAGRDAVRKAAAAAADATLAPADSCMSRMLVPVVPATSTNPEDSAIEQVPGMPLPNTFVSGHTHARVVTPAWSAVGRGLVGIAVAGTGAFIAYTSMRANAWFGHSLTPDPAAGEIYARLSVAAELLATLMPTAIMVYRRDGDRRTALRGWVLMAVCLVVVFFAAGGFAVSNLSAGTEVKAERSTSETALAERKLATIANSRGAECSKRGPRCRELEQQERAAMADLAAVRAAVAASADPQAVALGVSSGRLHAVQGGAMVLLCLCSGLFVSYGMGLIFGRRSA